MLLNNKDFQAAARPHSVAIQSHCVRTNTLTTEGKESIAEHLGQVASEDSVVEGLGFVAGEESVSEGLGFVSGHHFSDAGSILKLVRVQLLIQRRRSLFMQQKSAASVATPHQ